MINTCVKTGITGWFFGITACGSLADDLAPNFTTLNYNNMELDLVHQNNNNKHQGVAPLWVDESNYKKSYVDIVGIHKGTLHVYSDDCQLNFSKYFNGLSRIYIADLIKQPKNCTIVLRSKTEQIKDLEHNISEIGKIDIMQLPAGRIPLNFVVQQTTSIGVKTNRHQGTSFLQLPEGQLAGSMLNLESESTSGMYSVNSSCQHVPAKTGKYAAKAFQVPIDFLFNKNSLEFGKDNCNFFITTLPDERFLKPSFGRVDINTYSKQVVPLEFATVTTTPGIIKACGGEYVVLTQINERYSQGCTTHTYKKDEIYWIRMLTKNGRKSVVGYKDGKFIL